MLKVGHGESKAVAVVYDEDVLAKEAPDEGDDGSPPPDLYCHANDDTGGVESPV